MQINSAVPTVFVKYDIREKWSILVKDQAIHPCNNISHAVNSVVALSKSVTEKRQNYIVLIVGTPQTVKVVRGAFR